MSESAEIRIERPLVTFALFAYNQEKYIREAIEGALSQTYEPLEIIISDDCSTDNTFEIINQTIKLYKGPHKVLARQTKINSGTLLHVAEVGEIASGKLLVLAAGDDISKPERVSTIQKAWEITGAWGLCSKFDFIDETGACLQKNIKAEIIDSHDFMKYFFPTEGNVNVVHGCTSAYDIQVFNYIKPNKNDYILAEDGALSFLLNLIGKDIYYIDHSLIKYRKNSDSLTNNLKNGFLSLNKIKQDENNIVRLAKSQMNRCKLFIRLDDEIKEAKIRRANKAGIIDELYKQESICLWYELSLYKRLSLVYKKNIDLRWALPRMFGKRLLYLFKWVFSRLNIESQ